jgi:hypothetical protein
LSLAVVRDLREARAPAGPDELAAFETDVLAGFVLARAAAGLADATIRSDVTHLEQMRAWFGRPLWDMQPADADVYFGTVLRDAAKGTRLGRSQALKTYFLFLEIRHKVEIHQLTGRVAECPVDEMNRPRGAGRAALRIPPSAVQVAALFAGWRGELATCRKFAPAARSYAAARLMAEAGLRGQRPAPGRCRARGSGPGCPASYGEAPSATPAVYGVGLSIVPPMLACCPRPLKSPAGPDGLARRGAPLTDSEETPHQSGDLELLVAEVGDELESATEGGDVAVQDVLCGDIAAFDLGDPGNRNTHPDRHLLLCHPAPLAHLG